MRKKNVSARTRGGVTRRAVGALLVAASCTVMMAPPAAAHGIAGDAATASVAGFVSIGMEHMLLGWDHLLFVAGIVLLAGQPRRAAKVISAFVAGHSLTLITATLAGWQVNATAVDVVIVLSVALVGGWGMLGAPRRWDVFTGIVFGFGLIHGFGLATRFQALGVPEDGMVWKLIAFNIGIEIGQLTAIIGAVAIAAVLTMSIKQERHPALTKTAFVALFAVGSMAAPLLALDGFRSVGGTGELEVALPDGAECTITEPTQTLPADAGGHTAKSFYAPGEALPLDDFGHSLADGYVVVLYPEDAAPGEVADLQYLVESDDPQGVLAGSREDAAGEFTALTLRHEMTCEGVEVGALRQFGRAWIESTGATS